MTRWTWRGRCGLMVGIGSVLFITACAPSATYGPMPQLPENAMTFTVGYNEAFDRIVNILRGDGYEIAVADRRAGVIQTLPKALKRDQAQGGPFEYKTFFSIMVHGGWSTSWALVNLVVLPDYPKEREQVIKQIEDRLRTHGD